MKRAKITYKAWYGKTATGYAILPVDPTEDTYFWCFHNKDDAYGFTLHTSDIIKIF
jgi:hypothetical protein